MVLSGTQKLDGLFTSSTAQHVGRHMELSPHFSWFAANSVGKVRHNARKKITSLTSCDMFGELKKSIERDH